MQRILAVLLVLATWCPHASAQSPAESSATDAEARGLFLAGQAAFDDARYADALGYFRQAYELSGRPGLLYNVGVAADRLRRDDEALAAFSQFLREAPEDHPSYRDAEARVRVLRGVAEDGAEAEPEVDAPPPPTAEPPSTEAPPATTPSGADTTPAWIVVGAAAAVAVTGAVLLGVGQADADSVAATPDGTPWADVQHAATRADLMRNLGWVLAGVGLAGIAGGLTWALVAGSQPTDATATLRIGPGGAQLRGEF